MTIPYSRFAAVTPDDVRPVAVVDRQVRDTAAGLAGPGLASVSAVADHLRIGRRSIADVLAAHRVPVMRTRRVRWDALWQALWQIPTVPPDAYDAMMAPLLTVADVAEITGMSTRSILRDGDRARSAYALPRHVRLSERNRRYHPEMIHLWAMQQPLEDWMRPVKTRPKSLARALRPRAAT